MSKKGLALDIDETLSWTNLHWFSLLYEQIGDHNGLTVEETIAEYRYAENVPTWQTNKGFELMDIWRNDDKFQETIPLIQGADMAVQKINKVIPIVAYITSRPDVVVKGTRKWLKKHNFPKAKLIARPNDIPHKDGNRWKAEVLEDLYPEVVGIVDDNKKLVDSLSKDYRGTVFLYNHTEVDRDDIKVIPCRDWKEVTLKVSKLMKTSKSGIVRKSHERTLRRAFGKVY